MDEQAKSIPRVVIIGAGFGGLNAALRLRKAPVEILLIDRHNYHTFQPLLYQVATAGLEPEEIAHAVRGVFQKQRNVSFRLADVEDVEAHNRCVVTSDGERVPYDFLIVAAGATTAFFGVDGAATHSFTLKSLSDATRLRSHIIRQFESADRDRTKIDAGALTFVVVGGGPTGVEMAGALVELFELFRKDFPSLPIERARVTLVELRSELLTPFHRESREYALRTLRKRNVEVRLDTGVVRVSEYNVTFDDGTVLPAQTVVWAAGVTGEPIGRRLPAESGGGGRIELTPALALPSNQEVFVIGDLAGSRFPDGEMHPQLAPVAIQAARYVAKVIESRVTGKKSPGPFRYRDKGIMATVGRNAGVAELAGGIRTSGFLAWLMWLFLHLVLLVGFRNRMNVLVNWAWNYFTYDRSARLIFEDTT